MPLTLTSVESRYTFILNFPVVFGMQDGDAFGYCLKPQGQGWKSTHSKEKSCPLPKEHQISDVHHGDKKPHHPSDDSYVP